VDDFLSFEGSTEQVRQCAWTREVKSFSRVTHSASYAEAICVHSVQDVRIYGKLLYSGLLQGRERERRLVG
jgi:hypothetical protein